MRTRAWPTGLPPYYAPNYPRLRQVKARHDPADLFRHPQSIGLR